MILITGIVTGALGIIIKNGGHLFPRNGGIGAEFPISRAACNAVLRGPVDAAGVVHGGRYISKTGAGILSDVNACFVAQYGDKHATTHWNLRSKSSFTGSGKETGAHRIVHMGIEPVILIHIGELVHTCGRSRPYHCGHKQDRRQEKCCNFPIHVPVPPIKAYC